MSTVELQANNQALRELLQACAEAFGEIQGFHSTDRDICNSMTVRIRAELARQGGPKVGSCGCDGLCRQRDLASDEVDKTCRAVHGAETPEPEQVHASTSDDEAGLNEWAAGKFRHGRFVDPLYGNTDWALSRKVWSAAMNFARAHFAPAAALGAGQSAEKGDETYLVVDPDDNFHICFAVKGRQRALSRASRGLVVFGPIEQRTQPSDDDLARAAFERAHPAPEGITFDSTLKQYMCGVYGSLADRDAYQKLWKEWKAGRATQPAVVQDELLSRLSDFARFVIKCVRNNGEYAPLSMREPHEIETLLAGLPAQSSDRPVALVQYGTYETQAGESVAGIALRQLGDESRWVEIRNLNEDAFPDMERHEYYPVGTVLKMPVAHVAKIAKGEDKRQLQLLGQALGECIAAAGIIRPDVSLSGPELLMFAEDLKRHLAEQAVPVSEPDMVVRVRNRNGEVMTAEEVATSAWFDNLPDGTVVELHRRAALMRGLGAGTPGKFRMGDPVRKTSGSEWAGRIVGWYMTENTPEGYAVESEAHKGSVQIYPAHALTAQGGSDE